MSQPAENEKDSALIRWEAGETVGFDLPPPGLGRMLTPVFAWFTGVCVFGPLAFVGIYGALLWKDFGAVRIPMAIGGLVALGLTIGSLAWILGQAWWRRERVLLSRDGLAVGVALPWGRWTWEMTDRTSIRVDRPPVLELSRAASLTSATSVRISDGGQSVQIGLGLSKADLNTLQASLETLISKELAGPMPDMWDRAHAHAGLLHPGTLLRSIARTLRRPLPYLIWDGACILGAVFGRALFARLDLVTFYPLFAAVALLGLGLRRLDPSYVRGMAHHLEVRPMVFVLGFPAAFATVGLAAGFCLFESNDAPWASLWAYRGMAILALFTALSTGLGIWLLRAGMAAERQETRPPRRPVLELLCGLTLFPLALAHEEAAFRLLGQEAGGNPFFSMPLLFCTVLAVYLPVRVHYFVDNPGDRANLASFFVTVVILALFGIFGIRV